MLKYMLLAGAILVVAGCGAGASPSAQPSANPAQLARQFTQCVRDPGDPNFPDPTVDAQGRPQLPPGTATPPAETMSACQAQLNRAQTAINRSEQPDVATMLRLAQCLRAHGIPDWPDPDAQGRFHLPADLVRAGVKQQLRDALSGPCRQYDLSGATVPLETPTP